MDVNSPVRIAGLDYSIKFEDPATSVDLEGGTLSGCIIFDGPNQRIVISETASGQQQMEALLHEIFHGVDRATAPPGEHVTEAQTWRLSRGLFAVFRDNPDIPRVLAGEREIDAEARCATEGVGAG